MAALPCIVESAPPPAVASATPDGVSGGVPDLLDVPLVDLGSADAQSPAGVRGRSEGDVSRSSVFQVLYATISALVEVCCPSVPSREPSRMVSELDRPLPSIPTSSRPRPEVLMLPSTVQTISRFRVDLVEMQKRGSRGIFLSSIRRVGACRFRDDVLRLSPRSSTRSFSGCWGTWPLLRAPFLRAWSPRGSF